MLDIRVPPRSADDPEMQSYLRLIGRIAPKPRLWWQDRPQLPPLTPRSRSSDGWSPQDTDEVFRLIRQQYSRLEIARAYGVTRNCICGVVHRERTRRMMRNQKSRAE